MSMGAGLTYGGFSAIGALAAGLFGAMPAVANGALPPLRDDAHIIRVLVSGYVGDRIRQTCPEISARMLRVAEELWKLERYARAQGYTEDDVRAFMRSADERARLRGMGEAYLASKGVAPGDEAAHCRLGREEIARNSQIGYLLKDNAPSGRKQTD